MKKIVIAITAIAALMVTTGFDANAKEKVATQYIPVNGVGPAVAASESTAVLPKKAQKFIEKMGAQVVSVEQEFATGKYEVAMSDGMEYDFNKHGKVIEVDAPDNATIGADIIKMVVPRRLYSTLNDKKITGSVSSIEQTEDGYKVEFIGELEEALFNRQGELIAMYYD